MKYRKLTPEEGIEIRQLSMVGFRIRDIVRTYKTSRRTVVRLRNKCRYSIVSEPKMKHWMYGIAYHEGMRIIDIAEKYDVETSDVTYGLGVLRRSGWTLPYRKVGKL